MYLFLLSVIIRELTRDRTALLEFLGYAPNACTHSLRKQRDTICSWAKKCIVVTITTV